MAAPKIMSGARAKVSFYDRTTGEAKAVGIFHSINYGVVYDTAPAYILGRFSAAEIDYTAAEIVSITCSGWRVLNHGWHDDGRLPRVQDLLFAEELEMLVTDRATEALGGEPRVALIKNVRAVSGSGGYNARQLSEATFSYVGILVDDESGSNHEHPTATDLP